MSEELSTQIQSLIEAIEPMLPIQTNADYERVGKLRVDLGRLLKRIDEHHNPDIKKAHNLHRSMLETKQRLTRPLEDLDIRAERSMSKFRLEEMQRARQIQAEAQATLAAAHEERVLEEACALERAGQSEAAEALLTRPAPMIAIQPKVPEAAGIVAVKRWKFQVWDAAALPREYLVPDEKKIGSVVRALKNETRIPGVRVWAEDDLTVRT